MSWSGYGGAITDLPVKNNGGGGGGGEAERCIDENKEGLYDIDPMDVDSSDVEVEDDFDVTLRTPHRPTSASPAPSSVTRSASSSPTPQFLTSIGHMIAGPIPALKIGSMQPLAAISTLSDNVSATASTSPVFTAPVNERSPISADDASALTVTSGGSLLLQNTKIMASVPERSSGSAVESLSSPAPVEQQERVPHDHKRSRSSTTVNGRPRRTTQLASGVIKPGAVTVPHPSTRRTMVVKAARAGGSRTGPKTDPPTWERRLTENSSAKRRRLDENTIKSDRSKKQIPITLRSGDRSTGATGIRPSVRTTDTLPQSIETTITPASTLPLARNIKGSRQGSGKIKDKAMPSGSGSALKVNGISRPAETIVGGVSLGKRTHSRRG